MQAYLSAYGRGHTALWDAGLRVGPDTFFHAPSVEPFPHQPHAPSLIAPFPPHVSSPGPVDAVDIATDLCLHDPAATLRHAPLASRLPCIRGAATLATARGAVPAIWLLDGFPPHGDRSLDPLVLPRRLPKRTWPPSSLVEPDALDRRGLGAPAAPALVEGVEGRVAGCRVLLRRHPVASWRARRARPVRGLPQKVSVAEGCERRQDARGIAGGLRCHPLELWCDGGGSQGLARRSVPLNVMPGVAFPPGGPVGLGSPPSAGLGVAQTASLPVAGRFARRSLPDPLPAAARSW